jgi:PAS domain S-box-containing protein
MTISKKEGKDDLKCFPLWLVASLILLSGCLLSVALYVMRLQAIQNGERLTASFAQVVQEQTTRSFQEVEQGLYLVKSELRRLRNLKTLTEASARTIMKAHIRTSPFLSSMFVLNPKGQVVYESDEGSSGRFVTMREQFLKYLGEPTAHFKIALPVLGKTTGRWRIAAAIPWTQEDGSYAGQIVAIIELPYFEKVWGDVDLGADGTIQLFRRDGFLMIRSPHLDNVIGTNFSERPLFRENIRNSPQGRFESTSEVDGVTRIFAYRSLTGKPEFFVLVGQSLSTILGPWRKWAFLSIALWGLAVIVLTASGVYLNRAWQEKRRMEIDAQKMAQRLTMATEAGGIAVFDWNRNKDLMYMSPTFFTMLGQVPEETRYVRSEAFEKIHPDDRKSVIETLRSTIDVGALQFEYEARLKHADNSYRWIYVTGRVIESDQDRKPTRVIGIRIDVTARHQAEEERLKILERITDGFIALDKSFRYSYINRKAAQLLGSTPERLIGQNIWTEFPEGSGGRIRSAYEKAMLEQQHAQVEEYFPKYKRWFENFIYPSPEGLSIYFHDITDRKAAQTAALATSKRLRDLIDGLGPAIFVGLTSPQGILLEANLPALKAAGLTPQDVIGKPLDETYWMSGSESSKALIRSAIERGTQGVATRHDMQIRGLGEQFILVDFSLRPILDELGKVVFLVPSAQVITEREEALAALRVSVLQQQALSRQVIATQESERRRLARELHDELGQSLTALKLNLASRGRRQDPALPDLDLENSQIVEDTLQQVRRLALGLRPSILDDFGLISALKWLVEQTNIRGHADVSFEMTGSLGRFDTDIETCYFRIAQEALTNMVRHSQASQVKVLLRQNSQQLILEVKDDGLGFDTRTMRARATLGQSIGLLGMQERANLIGGYLEIESKLHEGCTVRLSVSLPVDIASLAPA